MGDDRAMAGDAGDLPELGAWDETLREDGDQATDLPDDRALREAVLEQRFAHGLLSHYFEGRDAREARVRRIIEALPEQAAGGGGGSPGNVLPFWRRFAPAVVAATALFAFGGWFAGWFDDDDDEVRALIAAARDHADDPVDRRYVLLVHRIGPGRELEQTGEHTFTLRPGGVFRIALDGEKSGVQQLGCDGERAWQVIIEGGKEIRKESPADKVREMFREGLNPHGFFDVGYLNVDRVLSKVSNAVSSFDYSFEAMASGGQPMGHVHGTADLDLGLTDLTYLSLFAEESTGEVKELMFELHDEVTGENFRFQFLYRGEVTVPDGYYARPW